MSLGLRLFLGLVRRRPSSAPAPDLDLYYRPGGVFLFRRPGGVDLYKRP